MTMQPVQRKDVRTTISLAPVVMKIAEEMQAARGYNNFSAYVADLIRRDQERYQDRQRLAPLPPPTPLPLAQPPIPPTSVADAPSNTVPPAPPTRPHLPRAERAQRPAALVESAPETLLAQLPIPDPNKDEKGPADRKTKTRIRKPASSSIHYPES